MPRPSSAFEELAGRYDAWYDSAHGRRLFDLEVACLRPLLAPGPGPRLEIGVGSGRFAGALGLEVGLDPAVAPLRLAAARGVVGVQGTGERLPFSDGAFAAVVLVLTLCFADDPAVILGEIRRVLAPSGHLVAGVVPLDSAWGRSCEEQGRTGHPCYRSARFLTLAEHCRLLAGAGFSVVGARSTLTQAPSDEPTEEEALDGLLARAGFVALQARTVAGGLGPREGDGPRRGPSSCRPAQEDVGYGRGRQDD